MRVIKNINNNVAVCIDENGNELVAFGKGIGFRQPPYIFEDLSKIHRTYYNVAPQYLEFLNQLDPKVFEVVNMIMDYAYSKIDAVFDNNIAFTLADHIQFAMKRCNNKMKVKFTSYHGLDYMNPEAVEVGEFAIKKVKEMMGVQLPYEEVYGIAIHLLNEASVSKPGNSTKDMKAGIDDIIRIIEQYFKITIDKRGFNYVRFVSRMENLFERKEEERRIDLPELNIVESLKTECPDAYACAKIVAEYFEDKEKKKMEEEEILYLTLHINRLCSHAECST